MNVMRTTVATVVAATLSMSAFSAFAAASLTGAGATFPAPVYAKWADTYQKETGNKVNYQGIGSSGGVKQIIANTVDFGASDAPLADDKLTQEGLFQFPTVIGGVVLAVNLPGVKSGELVLDGKTLGDIYLGKIKKWDDEAIAKLNPGLKLPSQNIAVVRRADGSGTSFVFTSYLSKVNEEWKSKIGAGSTVNWPTGLGGKGNDAQLRENMAYFLRAIVPVCEEVGIRLAVHPDDPPRPILGLPRIVSTIEDMQWLKETVDSINNGFTMCTGSYGVRADNDLVKMVETFGDRIHFTHLRSTCREANPKTFHEAAHLSGDVNMVAVVDAILREEQRRKQAGDLRPIPFRPDHGHQMLDDLRKKTNPGYSAIGRLKGMAEVRGVELALKMTKYPELL